MQQRFCTCGYTIWVQYICPNKECRIIFKSNGDDIAGNLTHCPCCNQILDIDTLQ